MPNIEIKNLYVLVDTDSSFGELPIVDYSEGEPEPLSQAEETSADKRYDQAALLRLIQHIKFLAVFADEYHKNFYCEQPVNDDKPKIKDDCLDNITRLLTSEFSFYSAHPMEIELFSELLTAIQDIARLGHENVHLLLSSFAVLNERKELINMSLYVECGQNPRINLIAKSVAAEFDPDFNKQFTIFKPKKNDPQHSLASFSRMGRDIVATNGVFDVATASGAKYTQCLEVCAEYTQRRAKKILRNRSEEPVLTDHLVTSNTMLIDSEDNIVPTVTQIDPGVTPFLLIEKNDSLETTAFEKSFSQFEKTKLGREPTGDYVITDPPFGGNYKIRVGEPYELDFANVNTLNRRAP